MAKVGLVFLFLVLVGSPSWAEIEKTCASWDRLSEAARNFYVIGVADGVAAGIDLWSSSVKESLAWGPVRGALSKTAPADFKAQLFVVCRGFPTMNLSQAVALAVRTVLREKGAPPTKPPR